jgi:hypothetical protein
MLKLAGMSFTMKPLTPEESAARDSALEMAATLVGAGRPLTMANVQALYDALLNKNPSDEALISLGMAFGEQIIARSDFEWVRIIDEYGEETCVAAPGKDIFCPPISMIQKRIRRSEAMNLSEFADGIIEMIREKIAEDKPADR